MWISSRERIKVLKSLNFKRNAIDYILKWKLFQIIKHFTPPFRLSVRINKTNDKL